MNEKATTFLRLAVSTTARMLEDGRDIQAEPTAPYWGEMILSGCEDTRPFPLIRLRSLLEARQLVDLFVPLFQSIVETATGHAMTRSEALRFVRVETRVAVTEDDDEFRNRVNALVMASDAAPISAPVQAGPSLH